jgi:hypothetical protein
MLCNLSYWQSLSSHSIYWLSVCACRKAWTQWFILFSVPRHDSCPHGVSAIRTVSLGEWFPPFRRNVDEWFFLEFSLRRRKHCIPWNCREPQGPATHRHVPEDLNSQLHELRKVTLSRFVVCCFPSSLIVSFNLRFFPHCLFFLDGVISDPNKISDKLTTRATQSASVTTAP